MTNKLTCTKALTPGTTLGLMGGGQLGRMFAQSAATMGFHVCVLDPNEKSPASEVSLEHLKGAYTDPALLDEMVKKVPAVTTEFENVPATALRHFEEAGLVVAPPSTALAVTQDRNLEKAFAQKAGLKSPPTNLCVLLKNSKPLILRFSLAFSKPRALVTMAKVSVQCVPWKNSVRLIATLAKCLAF